jgi:hypothetical protein
MESHGGMILKGKTELGRKPVYFVYYKSNMD